MTRLTPLRHREAALSRDIIVPGQLQLRFIPLKKWRFKRSVIEESIGAPTASHADPFRPSISSASRAAKSRPEPAKRKSRKI